MVTNTDLASSVARLAGVSHEFASRGSVSPVLDNIDLEVGAGEFVSIVGPSGCGKSTILNLLAGLYQPASGTLEVLGAPVRLGHPAVGFVFQRDALLPWRTALANVSLPLRFRHMARRKAEGIAREWLGRVGLAGFEDRYPDQLSGGMRKRVSIAATLVYEPRLILMDEPFSALDAQTRTFMEDDLLEMVSGSGQTVLFVTHDLEEAIGLADRVVVLSAGPARLIGDYRIDLARPRDLFELRGQADFQATYRRLWSHLRDEVHRSRTTGR